MHTLTFSSKASISALLSRSLLTLMVLFAGINVAWAQYSPGTSTVSLRQARVTYGTASSSQTTNFDASSNSNTSGGSPSAGIFNNTDFGSYDVNSGRLVLQGGTIDIQEVNGEIYTQGYIIYGVGQGTLTSTSPNLSNTLQLTDAGYSSGSAGNGTHTFTLNNGARDILALVTATGNQYRFDVAVSATGRDAGGDDIIVSGNRRRSVFTPTGTPSTATINPNNIQLAADGVTSSTSYYFPNTGTSPQFPGYNFTSSQNAGGVGGAFDINNGQLRLTNTTVTTTETGANTINNVVLYYRVRASGSGGGAFQPITLSQSGTASNGTKTFIIDPANASNNNPQPNLIATAAVGTVGDYVIDVYYQASGINSASGSGTPFTITYPPTGFSSATFTVGGTPVAVTIWTGSINDNWFDAANWTNGVPTRTTNALIRDLGAGNTVPYPNIRSNYRYTTAGGALIYDNTNSGPAEALNFVMGGSSQASRSIARLVVGQLRVFGTFDNSFDSFIQRENTIMEFAGGNQSITGGTFIRVDISGGGTKTLQNVMLVSEAINFLTPGVYQNSINPLVVNPFATLADNAGVLATDITQPVNNYILLNDRADINYNNGAQLNGETDASYLYGFVRTTRQGVSVNETRTYGNLGMTLTFTGANDPNSVEVTRNTVEAYNPITNRFGVRRIFGVRPSNQTTNNGGLVANMVFKYRNSETKRLNGPDTRTYGTERIPEERLTIFVSSNSGNSFQLVGRDAVPDTVNNTVTRTGVRTFATFTLGDILNPLPVNLVAFAAVRSGDKALITWSTATEENNKGFNVQVSTDGVKYRNLSFVDSKNSNSVTTLNYSYTDTEGNKVGTRYYRLEQVDFSGKTSYSPVRAVSFSGAAATSLALAASPNPFNDYLSLAFEGLSTTDGPVHVRLLDMTGRTIRDQDMTMSGASVALTNLSELRSGLYLAKVTLADGTTKTVRVQRQ